MQIYSLVFKSLTSLFGLVALVCLPALMSAQSTRRFSVVEYGTKADEVTLDTAVIQRAIVSI
ncbi:MAG: hypothetical protein JWQ42_625 [Edaphobacter sp.]|jgi:hypothetical protein|nr:hypothetical protein [Edaphobacter sp.]